MLKNAVRTNYYLYYELRGSSRDASSGYSCYSNCRAESAHAAVMMSAETVGAGSGAVGTGGAAHGRLYNSIIDAIIQTSMSSCSVVTGQHCTLHRAHSTEHTSTYLPDLQAPLQPPAWHWQWQVHATTSQLPVSS